MSKNASLHVRESAVDNVEKPVDSEHIAPRYRGTEADRHDMSVLGKKQVLRRQFKFSTMLGFASTVMVAWEFVLFTTPFTLQDGGTAGVSWGLLICPFVMLPIYASLAEVASMSPTSGGQYHWVSELAPPSFQKGLSYSVGWLIALGWQTFLCSVSYLIAGMILGLAVLNFESYSIQSWHTTLLTIAVVTFCTLFNIFLTVRLPLLEVLVLILHVLGVFVVVIPLWVMAPRGNTHDTIFGFVDNGGWNNIGLSSLIGIVPMIGMLIGYDCSVHMAEEVNDASRTLPKVIIWAVITNAAMLILVGITYVFCIGNVEQVLNTATYQPVIQVFYNATRSKAGTTVMCVVIIIVFLSACVGQVATASRQMWSFARDGGLPFSPWLEQVAPGWNIPIHAIVVSASVTSLLSLINIGSYYAFNALNSLGTTSILFSYMITIGTLIYRRLWGTPLPARRWSLGRWGLWINIYSLCVTLPMLVIYVFPLTHPVTPQNMNWASTMFGGVLIIAGVYYIFKGRKDYHGPVVLVKREE